MVERRRYERFSLRLAATIRLINDDKNRDSEVFDPYTQNICAGGAFLPTSHPVPKGKQVEIDLVLNVIRPQGLTKKKAHIRVKGKVIRTDSTGIAVCFDKHYRITRI
jgi:c-di-GMP-binding flagellar brake protein YcgR